MSPEAALVSATRISKGFGRRRVLEGAALEARPTRRSPLLERTAPARPRSFGCAGLIPADSGEVRVSGPIGYCPQDPGIFELLTAEEHLVLFGRAMGLPRRQALAKGRSLLDGFGFPQGERGGGQGPVRHRHGILHGLRGHLLSPGGSTRGPAPGPGRLSPERASRRTAAVLEALSLPIVAGSSALMVVGSSPPRPWILVLAVAMVALVAIPFGLAVAALRPRELEATLVLIGVAGIQLSLDASAALSKVLPFYGPQQLLEYPKSPEATALRNHASSRRRLRYRRVHLPAGDQKARAKWRSRCRVIQA
jgi:hypothetical protein